MRLELRKSGAAVLAPAALLLPRIAAAGVTAEGSAFQINDVDSKVVSAAAARAPDGTLIVAWNAYNDSTLRGRRLTAEGAPLGPSFVVSATGGGGVLSVATNSSGDFVIGWGAYARVFSASGGPLGSAFQFADSAHPLYGFSGPASSVALDAHDHVVAVWVTSTQSADVPVDYTGNVLARRFTAAGVALDAAPFQVNAASSLIRSSPAVAVAPDGSFVVSWVGSIFKMISTGYFESFIDFELSQIQFQRYSAAAVREGGQASLDPQIGDGYSFRDVFLSASMNASGEFALAWSYNSTPYKIHAQRFTAQGFASSGEITYSAGQNNTTRPVAVGIDSRGDFVAAYNGAAAVHGAPVLNLLAKLSPGSAYGVAAPAAQAVAMGADGSFVLVYENAASASTTLQGQLYQLK